MPFSTLAVWLQRYHVLLWLYQSYPLELKESPNKHRFVAIIWKIRETRGQFDDYLIIYIFRENNSIANYLAKCVASDRGPFHHLNVPPDFTTSFIDNDALGYSHRETLIFCFAPSSFHFVLFCSFFFQACKVLTRYHCERKEMKAENVYSVSNMKIIYYQDLGLCDLISS